MLNTTIENGIVLRTKSTKILARPEKGKRRRRVHKLNAQVIFADCPGTYVYLTAWGKVADALAVALKENTRLFCTTNITTYMGKVFDPITKSPVLNADGTPATALKYNLTISPVQEILIDGKVMQRNKCLVCGRPLTKGQFIGKECMKSSTDRSAYK